MLIQANALQIPLKDECVQTVITSPPYWGLRDYGTARWSGGSLECDHKAPNRGGRDPVTSSKQLTSAGTLTYYHTEQCPCGALRIDSQLGLERTPEEYVANMVTVFHEVWRVLRTDGTIWVNLGDSYASNTSGTGSRGGSFASERAQWQGEPSKRDIPIGLKPKDLVGVPWRVAFALQADGWYLRSDIIWSKPNPMPESVTDRPTKAHEYLFLMTKEERYFYDADAIREPFAEVTMQDPRQSNESYDPKRNRLVGGQAAQRVGLLPTQFDGRNRRTVWTIATQPWSGAHFATFPEKLVEPCILAGSRAGDLILDPFAGSGTVLRVAYKHQRKAVGLDISFKYLQEQATKRGSNVQVNLFV